MSSNYKKVEGHAHIVKDVARGTILNTNVDEINAARKRKDSKLKGKEETNKIKNDIENLKDDIKKMNDALTKEGFSTSIIEVYSPKRVTGMGDMLGLMQGMALDLTNCDEDGNAWDFTKKAMRDKAEQMIIDKKALLVIGSPMCSAFSRLQAMNWNRITVSYTHLTLPTNREV